MASLAQRFNSFAKLDDTGKVIEIVFDYLLV